MESAELRGSHTVWNQPSLSMRSYVCEPKKSRCACTPATKQVNIQSAQKKKRLHLFQSSRADQMPHYSPHLHARNPNNP